MLRKHKYLIIKFILFLLLIYSCKNPNEINNGIINRDLQNIVSVYIDSNPIEIKKIKDFPELIFPQPSYHIYLKKIQNDTFISIKLMPHLVTFDIYLTKDSIDNVDFYKEISPIGFLNYKNKPLVFFDENNLGANFVDIKKLQPKIPDSLKFEIGKENRHIKSDLITYKFYKNTFTRLNN